MSPLLFSNTSHFLSESMHDPIIASLLVWKKQKGPIIHGESVTKKETDFGQLSCFMPHNVVHLDIRKSTSTSILHRKRFFCIRKD